MADLATTESLEDMGLHLGHKMFIFAALTVKWGTLDVGEELRQLFMMDIVILGRQCLAIFVWDRDWASLDRLKFSQ